MNKYEDEQFEEFTAGDLTVNISSEPKRGTCLKLTNSSGEHFLMDYQGYSEDLVPQGSFLYLFGNKVIVLNRWRSMSDEEIDALSDDELELVLYPNNMYYTAIKLAGEWQFTITFFPPCIDKYNDLSKPFDKIIFIFSDPDTCYLNYRTIDLPEKLGRAFQRKAITSNEILHYRDVELSFYQLEADNDLEKDFYDILCHQIFIKLKNEIIEASKEKYDNIQNGIYIEIDKNNQVSNYYVNNKPKEPQMTGEVKMYYDEAQAGLAIGQYNLGYCYEHGDGIEQNEEQAVYWYTKAAEQGYAKAEYNLGICCYYGKGCEKDLKKSFELFLSAANKGDAYAMYSCAVAYFNGEGVEQNPMEAVTWLEKAAEKGHPEAKRILDSMFGK